MEYTKVKCTCCDELLTKPVFIDGLPYGSSCAKKVNGTLKSAAQFTIALSVVAVVYNLKSYKMVRFNNKLYTLHSLYGDNVINFKINTKDSKCLLSQAIITHATKDKQGDDSISTCLSRFLKSI